MERRRAKGGEGDSVSRGDLAALPACLPAHEEVSNVFLVLAGLEGRAGKTRDRRSADLPKPQAGSVGQSR